MSEYSALLKDLEMASEEKSLGDDIRSLLVEAGEAIEGLEGSVDELSRESMDLENRFYERESDDSELVPIIHRAILEGRKQGAIDFLGKLTHDSSLMSQSTFDNLFGSR